MKNKRLIALLLALCLVLGLCACGGNEDAPAQDAPEATDAPAVPEVTDAPEVEETAAPGVTYCVTVVDEGGNPISGAMVQVCQGEICLMPTATNEAGVAEFVVAEEAEYEAKFLTLPAGYDYISDEQVFHFDGSFELTITLKAVA